MNINKYLLFGGISLAIHGVAFSSSYKPITVAPVSDGTVNAVSIQLVTPQPIAKAQPSTKPEAKALPAPTPKVKTSQVKTETPVASVKKVPRKVAKPKIVPKQQPTEQVTKKPNKKSVQPKAPQKSQTAAIQQAKATKEAQVVTKEKVMPPSHQLDQPLANTQPQPLHSGKPKMIKKVSFSAKPAPIKYPRSAKRRNIEGLVLVEVWIDEQGRQTKKIIVDSSGNPLLDNAALAGIDEWKFKSVQEQGQRIAHRVQVPITFKIN